MDLLRNRVIHETTAVICLTTMQNKIVKLCISRLTTALLSNGPKCGHMLRTYLSVEKPLQFGFLGNKYTISPSVVQAR